MIQCRNNFQCKGSNNSQMILTVVTRPFFKESFIMQLLSLSKYGECIDEPNALARVFSLLDSSVVLHKFNVPFKIA